jgi:PAS domain S-box-containing protein
MYGFSQDDDLHGKNAFEFIDPEQRQRAMEGLTATFENGVSGVLEYTCIKKDGTTFPVELIASLIRDSENNPLAFVAVTRDITERKLIEKALKKSEKEYKILFENSASGIIIADIETKKFVNVNPAICQFLKYDKEELLKLSVEDIHPKKDLAYIISEFEAQAKGEKTLASEIPCLRKDGEIAYADINTAPISLNGNTYNVGFFTDITERKLAKEQKQRYTINNMFVDVLLTRLGQVYTSIGDNRAWLVALEQITQEPIKMLEGKFYYEFFPKGKIALEEFGKGICSFFDKLGMNMKYEIDENKLSLYNSECPWGQTHKHPLSCTLTRGIITKFATTALDDAKVEGGDTIMQGYSKCTFKVTTYK